MVLRKDQNLTERQKETLMFIYNSIKYSGYPPTLADLKEKLEVSSNQAVLDLLKILEEKKYIRKEEGAARGIQITQKGYDTLNVSAYAPMIGITAAGPFMDTLEQHGEWKEISPELAKLSEKIALFKVKGDSMIGVGLNDGDIVVVKHEVTEFRNGDIVLARSDDGTTIKRFVNANNKVYLAPENPKYSRLPITPDLRLIGKVISKYTHNMQNLSLTDKPINLPYFQDENIVIYNEDILKVNSIQESSVDLIVTSPPYNVDIHYNSHADDLTYEDYLEFTQKWIKKCFDLAKNEGRFLLNIPLDKNKGGQKSVGADITKIAKDIGWKYHSTIIWNEGNISRRTAWGSFMSASAPYVIAPVELILVLYKDSWKKTGENRKNDITKQEFMEWTNGVWTFNGQSKKGAGGHPAPFPIELPRRCIKLFSFVGETVLDPFLGSGSTLIASFLNNRKGIGIDIDKAYCDLAIKRLQQEAFINQSRLLN